MCSLYLYIHTGNESVMNSSQIYQSAVCRQSFFFELLRQMAIPPIAKVIKTEHENITDIFLFIKPIR